jgi:hypothetical protein
MMPNGQMITIKNRFVNGQDEYGNDKYSFTTSSVGPCSVQQAGSTEAISFNDQVVTGVIVFMPHGTTISYLDAFVIGDTEYEVVAEPETWVSPFSGHTAPVRVRGTIVKGATS